MNTTETAAPAARRTLAEVYNLRLVRGTTGTVHAGQEVEELVGDFTVAYELRFAAGITRTVTKKACGYDPNTFRRVTGTGRTEAEVTCKKCLKVLASRD